MVYTFLIKKNMLFYSMEIEIWKSDLNLKFDVRFKQKSKFEIYFLFFDKKININKKIRFLRVV